MMSDASDDIWGDDSFGRNEDAAFLKRFLIERIKERKAIGLHRSYVLNLDSGWGRGKSFFLTRFQKTLESEGYLVASVNAWRDDHADDPLIAVMAAIDQTISPHIKKVERAIWRAVKSNGMAVA
ncbi:MAG TPA: P-loop NTPase fold protein, partial [Pseudolabrys sp.]